ncbi:MAG: PcfB family protein [Christensenellaceae bacterium]
MANLAGKGALSLATFLIAALKDEKRTSGKIHLRSFRGKPTSVFVIRQNELKTFAQEAKNYGVLYAAVLDKRNPDGLCDIVVSAEDASRVNRIEERFALSHRRY